MMMRILFSSIVALSLMGCESTPLSTFSTNDTEEVSVETVMPIVNKSMAIHYLYTNKPLNTDLIALPFFFDGDTVLRDEFDLSLWRNKRFIHVEGKDYLPLDSYAVDMDKGEIRSLDGEDVFKDLLQSLVIRMHPLKGLEGTPRFLVLTNMISSDKKSSVLVIEDPISLKIHGFIESSVVNPNFSRSLYKVEN